VLAPAIESASDCISPKYAPARGNSPGLANPCHSRVRRALKSQCSALSQRLSTVKHWRQLDGVPSRGFNEQFSQGARDPELHVSGCIISRRHPTSLRVGFLIGIVTRAEPPRAAFSPHSYGSIRLRAAQPRRHCDVTVARRRSFLLIMELLADAGAVRRCSRAPGRAHVSSRGDKYTTKRLCVRSCLDARRPHSHGLWRNLGATSHGGESGLQNQTCWGPLGLPWAPLGSPWPPLGTPRLPHAPPRPPPKDPQGSLAAA